MTRLRSSNIVARKGSPTIDGLSRGHVNRIEVLRSAYLTFAFLLVAVVFSRTALAEDGTLTAFIVRHAEIADASRDPVLSDLGKRRAKRLARMLNDAEIEHVHSTNFKRTRATAAPTAGAFNIKVNLYDPRILKDLVTQLRQAKGRHLVVGHTNTVLKTIELLGGEPGFPIDKKNEFDRLYIVTVGKSGPVSTVLMRY